MVCTLDTAAVTELWQLDLFSCTSSSFLCAGTLRCLREANVAIFCGMTLPLNYIFVLLPANVDDVIVMIIIL